MRERSPVENSRGDDPDGPREVQIPDVRKPGEGGPTILDKARAAAAGENSRAPARSPHEAPVPEPPRQLEGDPKDATDIVNRIRELVKDVYGDSYDACPTSSTGAGLALCRAVAIPDSTMPEHEGTVRGHRMAVIPRQKPSEFLSEFHLLPPKYGLLPDSAFTATRQVLAP